jgi:hypothetical protein
LLMNAIRFDAVIRSLSEGISRRGALGGFAAALGLAMARRSESGIAKNKRRKNKNRRKKRKKNKNRQNTQQPQLNEFGCIDVGQQCFGRSDLCCSGICAGTPPKKGKPDDRRCAVHDTGGCQVGQRQPDCGGVASIPCVSTSGEKGVCQTTTGNAGFCAVGGGCFTCSKDADCQAVCGPAAACIRCQGFCIDGADTLCVGPTECPVQLPD